MTKNNVLVIGGALLLSLGLSVGCSEEDPISNSGNGGKTGGASNGTGGAVSGTGGGTGKTCGAMKVPSGCATADAALTTAQCKLCHTAAGAELFKTIDFMTDPKGSLLGKPAAYADLGAVVTPSTCPTPRETLLDANNFDTSLFVTKVRGSGFACGVKMPQGFPMTAADQACILAWACELTQ